MQAQPCARGAPAGQSPALGNPGNAGSRCKLHRVSDSSRRSRPHTVRAIAEPPVLPFRQDAKHLQQWNPQVKTPRKEDIEDNTYDCARALFRVLAKRENIVQRKYRSKYPLWGFQGKFSPLGCALRGAKGYEGVVQESLAASPKGGWGCQTAFNVPPRQLLLA